MHRGDAAALGTHIDLGPRLHRVFQAAGLPTPNMRFEGIMDPREDSPLYEYLADTAANLLPKAMEYGIPGAAELDVAAIAGRVRAEMNVVGYAMVAAPMVYAWCRKAYGRRSIYDWCYDSLVTKTRTGGVVAMQGFPLRFLFFSILMTTAASTAHAQLEAPCAQDSPERHGLFGCRLAAGMSSR